MVLSNEQQEIIKKFRVFLDNDNDVFILNSRAGTGKTSIIKDMFLEIYKETLFLGTTGRSVKVMKEHGILNAQTVYFCMYGNPKFNTLDDDVTEESTTVLSFQLKSISNNESFTNIKYILVDEASMLTDKNNSKDTLNYGSGEILTDLLNFSKSGSRKIKLIFLGDDHQLPPVGDNISKALDPLYLKAKFNLNCEIHSLTQNYRQNKNSLIYGNMNMISNLLQSDLNHRNVLDFMSNNLEVIKIDDSEVYSLYRKSASDIIISYENKKNIDYNNKIRASLGYTKELEIGDKIIFIRNIYRDFYNADIISGDFGIIKKVYKKITKKVYKNQEVYDLDFLKVDIYVDSIESGITGYILLNSLRNEQSEDFLQQLMYIECKQRFEETKKDSPFYKKYKNALNEYKNRKAKFNQELSNYESYLDEYLTTKEDVKKLLRSKYEIGRKFKPTLQQYGHSEEFTNFMLGDKFLNSIIAKYGNAITFYKAQGGSWKNVFVDFQGINGLHNHELRAMYTAISRAEQKLYLINPLKVNIFSKTLFKGIEKLPNESKPLFDEYIPSDERFEKLYETIQRAVKYNDSTIKKVREQKYQITYVINTSCNGSRLVFYLNKKEFTTCIGYSYLKDDDIRLKKIIDYLKTYK